MIFDSQIVSFLSLNFFYFIFNNIELLSEFQTKDLFWIRNPAHIKSMQASCNYICQFIVTVAFIIFFLAVAHFHPLLEYILW